MTGKYRFIYQSGCCLGAKVRQTPADHLRLDPLARGHAGQRDTDGGRVLQRRFVYDSGACSSQPGRKALRDGS